MKDRADLAVILASGPGTRLIQRDDINQDKGALMLAGRPLHAHVSGRIAPQAERLAVITTEIPAWAGELADGVDVLSDKPADGGRSRGQAGALVVALETAFKMGEDSLVLTVPVDAPFLPDDLYIRLAGALYASGAGAAIASTRGNLQPTFGLWRAALYEDVAHVVEHERVRSLQDLAGMARAVEVMAWDDVTFPPPFFTINTEDELRVAEDLAKLGI